MVNVQFVDENPDRLSWLGSIKKIRLMFSHPCWQAEHSSWLLALEKAAVVDGRIWRRKPCVTRGRHLQRPLVCDIDFNRNKLNDIVISHIYSNNNCRREPYSVQSFAKSKHKTQYMW